MNSAMGKIVSMGVGVCKHGSSEEKRIMHD